MNSAATHAPSIFRRSQHVDWILLMATLLTVLTGALMVHSTELGGGSGYFVRQMAAACIGFMGLLFLTLLPYQIFRTYVKAIYIFMIVVLVAVLVVGSNLRGTRGWFHLGPIYIQAPEIARLTFVLSIAGYLDQRIEWTSIKSLAVPFALALIPIGLIIIEPDFSSSLVFLPVTLVMFYVAGARAVHLLSVCLMGGIALLIPLFNTYTKLLGDALRTKPVLFFLARMLAGGWPSLFFFLGVCATLFIGWWFLKQMRFIIPRLYLWILITLIALGSIGAIATQRVLKDYQRKRLVAFVSPELDPLGGGYNVRQSQIAVGSGKIFGKGYGNGTQSRLGFLPSRHTDFIFSVLGEETGFVGSLFLLGCYFLIVWRGFDIAFSARDRYGSLVAAGFATMYAFYALLNVGMTMGLAPVAGVPLPMVSYGGSSLVASMFSIGLMMSVNWRRHML
jgi:rod shape determining protein RodA